MTAPRSKCRSKDNCFKAATTHLQEGDSIVIGKPQSPSSDPDRTLIATDNTNPDPEIRAQWIGLAKKHKVPIRCVWFKTSLQLCEHNDAVRALNKTVR